MSLKKILINDREELRVEFQQWKGRAYADIRIYAAPSAEETKWPTGKGILVPASQLHDLQKALAELQNTMAGAAVR